MHMQVSIMSFVISEITLIVIIMVVIIIISVILLNESTFFLEV